MNRTSLAIALCTVAGLALGYLVAIDPGLVAEAIDWGVHAEIDPGAIKRPH
jgi:hypothetical protein